MAQASHHYEPDSQQFPRLSADEQRIANAVVAALRPELKTIKDTQEQHTNTLGQHTKILNNLQQEMRGVNSILAGAGLIIDDPDN